MEWESPSSACYKGWDDEAFLFSLDKNQKDQYTLNCSAIIEISDYYGVSYGRGSDMRIRDDFTGFSDIYMASEYTIQSHDLTGEIGCNEFTPIEAEVYQVKKSI